VVSDQRCVSRPLNSSKAKPVIRQNQFVILSGARRSRKICVCFFDFRVSARKRSFRIDGQPPTMRSSSALDMPTGAKIVWMEQLITIGPDGKAFVGKRLLTGIRWISNGEVVREEQFHGLIVEADQEGLVVERADTGSRVVLPPQVQAAPIGEYKLRSTGEFVHNPDYLATWKFDQDEMPDLPEVPRRE